ncbi:hypothetical protein RND81_13G155300 [Saponaria officinalis]|uniref:Syntaxin N-terminal domain-containing protein n=1 Tax=Saponaria officinalis TaxID=3572 RepID=A0AAW1H3S6_SAPOF
MSFQYLRSAKQPVSRNPSQAVAGGIFQLNTDVAAFRHLVDSTDGSDYDPELRDKLDNISQDTMLLVKDTLDKLFDYFGWPFNQTTNVPLTRDEEIKGRNLVKDFQLVLEEFREALQLAAEPFECRSQSTLATVAASIVQIRLSVLDYRSHVDAIGTFKDSPEHRKMLQEIKQRIMASMIDTSAKLRALSKREHESGLVKASSVVKSEKKVSKMKKVFHRWWKSENTPLVISESENSEFVKLSNDFQGLLKEFQKARLLASRRSSSNTSSSSSSSAGANHDIMEAEPLFFDKWQESVVSDIEFNEPVFDEWIPRFREIENQVDQVNEIVATLINVAHLAHEQATAIYDISATDEAYLTMTSQTKLKFRVASTSIRSCPSWFWWLLIMLAIVIIVILLILIL